MTVHVLDANIAITQMPCLNLHIEQNVISTVDHRKTFQLQTTEFFKNLT